MCVNLDFLPCPATYLEMLSQSEVLGADTRTEVTDLSLLFGSELEPEDLTPPPYELQQTVHNLRHEAIQLRSTALGSLDTGSPTRLTIHRPESNHIVNRCSIAMGFAKGFRATRRRVDR